MMSYCIVCGLGTKKGNGRGMHKACFASYMTMLPEQLDENQVNGTPCEITITEGLDGWPGQDDYTYPLDLAPNGEDWEVTMIKVRPV